MVSTLAKFTIYWCCVAASYVVILGVFKLATKEASDRDYGMFQVCVPPWYRLNGMDTGSQKCHSASAFYRNVLQHPATHPAGALCARSSPSPARRRRCLN